MRGVASDFLCFHSALRVGAVCVRVCGRAGLPDAQPTQEFAVPTTAAQRQRRRRAVFLEHRQPRGYSIELPAAIMPMSDR